MRCFERHDAAGPAPESMSVSERPRTERNPDVTRKRILDAAFNAIYRNGYQGTRLGEIIDATGLTKGALYHHFPNKQALGYAVVDEIIREMLLDMWVRPLDASADPYRTLIDMVAMLGSSVGGQLSSLGCPLNNLAQEMSPLDEGFRMRLDAVYTEWHDALMSVLVQARQEGTIRQDIDPDAVATFIIASLEGCIGMSKNAQSVQRLTGCTKGLVDYLESMREHVRDNRVTASI